MAKAHWNLIPTRSVCGHQSPRPAAYQRGQSSVEIALMLPLLLLVVFGIAMSGFMFYAYIQVSNAAREGARAGSLYRTIMGNTSDTLDDAVYKAVTEGSTLGGLPTAPTNPTVVVTSTGSKSNPRPGDKITAQVTYSLYSAALIGLWPDLSATVGHSAQRHDGDAIQPCQKFTPPLHARNLGKLLCW